MKRPTKSLTFTHGVLALALLALTAGLVRPAEVQAQIAMSDYTATPPFVTESVPKNILILLDNSGSMNTMAYDDASEAFDPTKTYSGIFDAPECYQYDGTANTFVPDPAANPATMPSGGWTCTGNATYEWSGNLLDYATMRRFDIAKWVMVGGLCAVSRDAALSCSSVKGQDVQQTTFSFQSHCCQDQVQGISTADVSGRMPAAFIPSGSTVYLQLEGTNSNLRGKFCVDDDTSTPSSSDSTCQDEDEGEEFTEGEFVIRADQLTNSAGVLQQIGDKARFGMMEFSTLGTDGGVVQAGVGTDLANTVSAIEGTIPETWTPLAESLYEVARYYAQIQPAYNSGDYTYTVTAQDPYYFVAPKWAGTAQYAPCCESYVIVFTDGESTADLNIPSGLQDVADAVHGSHCTGSGCSGHRTDYPFSGTHYLDDVAYWAHTTDLRQATIPVLAESGKDLSGDQFLTVYTFYAFGNANARELLHSTAKAGAFIDQDGDNFPDATGQTCTYPAGSPFGSGDSTSSDEWDTDQDCVADAYFESTNADDLRDQLTAAITSIMQRGASGSAASVLASTSGEGAMLRPFFFRSTLEGQNEINWTGHAQSLFLDQFGNIREDTNGDAKLVHDEDKIVRTRLDTTTDQVVIDRFDDSDGDGLADSSTPSSTVGIKDVKSIWEGGERLALTDSSNRTIKTWIDQDNDGVVDGGEEIDFTTGNASDLDPYLRADASGTYTAANIINFIRGDQVTGMRNRQLTVGGSLKVWKLGDVIHATPIVVGAPTQRFDVIYGDSSYTAFFAKYYNRRQVAYVGANDGMLHAFNGGYYHRGDDTSTTTKTEHGYFTRTPTDNSGGPLLGDELFGFIPQELLPQLKWLTQTDYTHVYYVDLRPKVTDAKIFTADTDHPNGWGSILIGGFRMGGSCGTCVAGTGAPPMTVNADFNDDGDTVDADDTRTFYSAYFVLDVTNPEASDYPKLLWSFSSSDLGLTTSVPSMLRVSPQADPLTDDTNAKWYLVMGSGPTGYDGGIAQSGKLYAIDLKQGPGTNNGNVITMTAESLNAFMSTTVTVDTDYDYRVDAAYAGSVINDGSAPWRGKLYRLTMNDCTTTPCSTGTWGIDGGSGTRKPTEVLDTFPSSGSLELGPVAAQPAVAIDYSSKQWLFAGTGRLYNAVDGSTTEQQYFVGVKDSVINGGCTESSATNCHADDLVNMSSAEVCLVGTGDCGGATDEVTGVSGATNFPSLINLVAAKDGWYTTLPDSGERALFRPLAVGGLVVFPTFTPSGNVCDTIGSSKVYALYYMTGSANKVPVIGGGSSENPLTGTTSKNGKTYVNRVDDLGAGMASEGVVHKGTGSGDGKAGIFVQDSLGQVVRIETDTNVGIASRFTTWWRQAY